MKTIDPEVIVAGTEVSKKQFKQLLTDIQSNFAELQTTGSTLFYGSGPPAPTLGDNEDYYLDTLIGDLYQKQAGSWTIVGSLQGPPGDSGVVSVNGKTGTVVLTPEDIGAEPVEVLNAVDATLITDLHTLQFGNGFVLTLLGANAIRADTTPIAIYEAGLLKTQRVTGINFAEGVSVDADANGLANVNATTGSRPIVRDVGSQATDRPSIIEINGPLTLSFINGIATIGYGDFTEPVADFVGIPIAGFAPLQVQFISTSQGDVDTYVWNFGDSFTSQEASPVHTYEAPGSYTVQLVVSGSHGGNTATRTGYIVVAAQSDAPVPAFTATPVSGQTPLAVQFTDQSSGTITTRLWDFGDGTTSAVINPQHTYANAGAYTVKLTLTNPAGSVTTTKVGYINASVLGTAPVADFVADILTGNAPLTVLFTSTSSGVIQSYLWTFGDGQTSTAQNPSHTYAAAGSYTVSLQVTNPTGTNTKTRTAYVIVSAAGQAPAADFTGTPLTGNTPLVVQFTDTSFGQVTSWAWTFGDAGTSNVQNPSHSYAAAGVYTVTLTTTNSFGSSTRTRTAYVAATTAGTAPTANFTVNSATGAAPKACTFTDTSTGAPTSWAWNFGDGATATTQNPSHTYVAAGTYTVSLTAINASGQNTKTVTGMITVTGTAATAWDPVTHQDNLRFFVDAKVTSSITKTGNDISAVNDLGAAGWHLADDGGTAFTQWDGANGYFSFSGDGERLTRRGIATQTPTNYTFLMLLQNGATQNTYAVAASVKSTAETDTENSLTSCNFIRNDNLNGFTMSRGGVYSNPKKAMAANAYLLVGESWNGTNRVEVFNNLLSYTVAQSGPFGFNEIAVGGTPQGFHPFRGKIAFMALVSRALTFDEIQIWGGWAAHRWARTDLLAANDPYKTAPPTVISGGGNFAPVANFDGTPVFGTAPLTVQFTDQSTNQPTQWLWTFGDGQTSTSQNPSHIYAAAGTYNVSLQASNASGSNTKTSTGFIQATAPSGSVTLPVNFYNKNRSIRPAIDPTLVPWVRQPMGLIRDFYVDLRAGGAGNNGNSGSLVSPWATLQYASGYLTSQYPNGGSIVHVRGIVDTGTTSIKFQNDATPNNWNQFTNWIDGERWGINGCAWETFVPVGRYMIVSNLELNGSRVGRVSPYTGQVITSDAMFNAEVQARWAQDPVDAWSNGNNVYLNGALRSDGATPHHQILHDVISHHAPGGGFASNNHDYTLINGGIWHDNGNQSRYGQSGISMFAPKAAPAGHFDNETKRNFVRWAIMHSNHRYRPSTGIGNSNVTNGNGGISDYHSTNGYSLGMRWEACVSFFNGNSAIHAIESDNVEIINCLGYKNRQYVNSHGAFEFGSAWNSDNCKVFGCIAVPAWGQGAIAEAPNTGAVGMTTGNNVVTGAALSGVAWGSGSLLTTEAAIAFGNGNTSPVSADFTLGASSVALLKGHPTLRALRDILEQSKGTADAGPHFRL